MIRNFFLNYFYFCYTIFIKTALAQSYIHKKTLDYVLRSKVTRNIII